MQIQVDSMNGSARNNQNASNLSNNNPSGLNNQNLSGVGHKPIVHIRTSTTSDNNIITNKDYYVQFRPFLMHMLRALKPFFELIIFTDKTKEEAEAIINEIEKEQNFFTYIIPVNYCYYVPAESIYVKDVSIFYGNRIDSECLLVTTSAFDGLLQPLSIVPVEPFIGDDGDRILLILEMYLMTYRWSTDVRLKL